MAILIHFIILNTCIFSSYPYCPFICRLILPLSIDSPVVSSAAPPPDVSRATETPAASSSLPLPRRSTSMDGEPPPADDGGLAALDEAAPDALAAGPGWLAAGAVDALAAGSGALAVAPDGLGALASMKAWSTPASWRWNNCCRCPGTTWGCCRRWPPSRRRPATGAGAPATGAGGSAPAG